MYADDVVIWTTAKNTNKKLFDILHKDMNAALTALTEWSDNNNMKINVQKTNYQLFSLKTKTQDIHLQVKNTEIQKNCNTKYLGVILDNKLNLKDLANANHTTAKISSKSNILKRLAGVKWGGILDIHNETYKTYVKPNLLYDGEILVSASNCAIRKLEISQNNCLRIITGAVKSTPVSALHAYTNNKYLCNEYKYQTCITYKKILQRKYNNPWIMEPPAEQTLKSKNIDEL